MLTKINSRIKRRQKGFTLIELLLVVAILAVLAFLAVPAIATTIRNARIRTCASNEIMSELAVWRWYADEVARGEKAPFDQFVETGGFGSEGADPEDREWEICDFTVDSDMILLGYFRPSAVPECPFGFDTEEGYTIYVIVHNKVLEDVFVVCDNSDGGLSLRDLHDRTTDRSFPEGEGIPVFPLILTDEG